MDFQPLKYIYRPSENPGAYTLLLLHGTGGNEGDLMPLASSFGEGYNLLGVRGNVSENGMPRFFKRLGMGIFDEEDLSFRTDELHAFVQQLSAKEGFDSNKVIALGYSNGANIAGALLVKHPRFLAGAILFRPMQPFANIVQKPEGNGTPVFFSSGAGDPTIPAGATPAYLNILTGLGLTPEHHDLPAGHNLTMQDIKLAAQWLERNFGK